MLTQEYLQQRLDYDPDTGVFTWKYVPEFPPKWNTRYVGTPAGTAGFHGYNIISFSGKKYRASRLAWVYVYGSIPRGMLIDHINRIRADDRILNLRIATYSTNNANKTCLTGFRSNVYERDGKFVAMKTYKRKQYYCGAYPTFEEAKEASLIAHDIFFGGQLK